MTFEAVLSPSAQGTIIVTATSGTAGTAANIPSVTTAGNGLGATTTASGAGATTTATTGAGEGDTGSGSSLSVGACAASASAAALMAQQRNVPLLARGAALLTAVGACASNGVHGADACHIAIVIKLPFERWATTRFGYTQTQKLASVTCSLDSPNADADHYLPSGGYCVPTGSYKKAGTIRGTCDGFDSVTAVINRSRKLALNGNTVTDSETDCDDIRVPYSCSSSFNVEGVDSKVWVNVNIDGDTFPDRVLVELGDSCALVLQCVGGWCMRESARSFCVATETTPAPTLPLPFTVCESAANKTTTADECIAQCGNCALNVESCCDDSGPTCQSTDNFDDGVCSSLLGDGCTQTACTQECPEGKCEAPSDVVACVGNHCKPSSGCKCTQLKCHSAIAASATPVVASLIAVAVAGFGAAL
eukprot:TRINITY_DN5507_c0_g1_i2.p1 TRINITY_DN5507_c0_g1~~TRINITY_DN5507_c0_g1_i2.p1  ORF type:complete len:420 (-),score=127.54 TRINITY_DN5507_c0_g1_i2:40-1299(-)